MTYQTSCLLFQNTAGTVEVVMWNIEAKMREALVTRRHGSVAAWSVCRTLVAAQAVAQLRPSLYVAH